jgi:O-methyltransferase
VIKKLLYFAFSILRNIYLKLKVSVTLVLLLPEFYRIYADNSKRITGYKVKHLVDELRKVSSWHSNFLGLIDFWKLNPEFNEIFDRASKTPGNHITRCFMLYQFLEQIGNLEGDVAEVGVHKGRSAKVIALTSEKFGKNVYLFDTFTGMPEVDLDKDNFYRKGAFSDTSLAEVQEFLSGCENVTIYPGFFPDTAKPITEKAFSFVHVDVDIYRSVIDCCQFFYPRLVSKGMIIFDDPGFEDCKGAKIAVDEFFAEKEEFPIHLATAQIIVIKI